MSESLEELERKRLYNYYRNKICYYQRHKIKVSPVKMSKLEAQREYYRKTSKWTVAKIQALADQCTTMTQFRMAYPKAYSAAWERGDQVFMQVTKHLTRRLEIDNLRPRK